jgi:hypothetical protein
MILNIISGIGFLEPTYLIYSLLIVPSKYSTDFKWNKKIRKHGSGMNQWSLAIYIQSINFNDHWSVSPFPVALTWSIGHPWNALFHFSFLILRQLVWHLGRGINPSQGHYLHTGQHKHRNPCLGWDSNPRFQCWSERRRPLRRSLIWHHVIK